MKPFGWSKEKNEKLKRERKISFEEIVEAIQQGKKLADTENRNQKYSNQRVITVEVNNYAYLVPYVEDEEKIFFKTIIPSRKATKKYLKVKNSK